MQVLIVEDELTVANAMACALESRGHSVAVARSVQLALALPRPDVLIADTELPGLSGLDLLEQYKRSGLVPRTVFVTSNPSLANCRRALQLGAAEFLAKPFRLDELVHAVEQGLGELRAHFEQSYLATPGALEGCLRDVAAFATQRGIGPTCRARCCTALGEVIENVLEHAYPQGGGAFRIVATLDRQDLVLQVHDQGAGFDVAEAVTEAMADGSGLGRAAALAEDLDVSSEPGHGSSVTLHFGAYRVDFEGGDRADLTEFDFLTPETTRELLATLQLEEGESFFQLTPSMAVVVGRLLAGPDSKRLVAQALRS